MEEICKALVIGGSGAAAVVLTPAALAAILASAGFTSGGILAGSIAAKMMAYFAVANGGGVTVGSLVAILQSLGVAGLSGAGTGLAAGAGGVVGWLMSSICNTTVTN